MLIFGSMHVFLPLVPLYVAFKGGNEALMGIVASVFMIASLVLKPLAGMVVDGYGRKPVILASILVFAIAAGVLPFELDISLLIVVCVVQGLAWGVITPAVTTLIADWIPAHRRGEGIGYASTTRNISVALGSAAVLVLVTKAGFSVAFGLGALLAVAALASAFGIVDKYVPPSEDVGIFSRFKLIEKSAVKPAVVSTSMTFVMGGFMAFIPLDSLQRSVGSAIWFFVIAPGMMMLIRPYVGRLSDRMSNRGMLLIPGLLLVSLSPLVLGLTEQFWTLPLTAVCWALGFGTAQPIVRSMVLDRVRPESWGAANATSMMLFDLGYAAGPFILGFVGTSYGMPRMFFVSAMSPIIAIGFVLVSGLHRE